MLVYTEQTQNKTGFHTEVSVSQKSTHSQKAAETKE